MAICATPIRSTARPPVARFSSMWPRIQDEKLMCRSFRNAVELLGEPGERDVEAYFGQMGVPFPAVVGPAIAILELVGGLALVAGFLRRVL